MRALGVVIRLSFQLFAFHDGANAIAQL